MTGFLALVPSHSALVQVPARGRRPGNKKPEVRRADSGFNTDHLLKAGGLLGPSRLLSAFQLTKLAGRSPDPLAQL